MYVSQAADVRMVYSTESKTELPQDQTQYIGRPDEEGKGPSPGAGPGIKNNVLCFK